MHFMAVQYTKLIDYSELLNSELIKPLTIICFSNLGRNSSSNSISIDIHKIDLLSYIKKKTDLLIYIYEDDDLLVYTYKEAD